MFRRDALIVAAVLSAAVVVLAIVAVEVAVRLGL